MSQLIAEDEEYVAVSPKREEDNEYELISEPRCMMMGDVEEAKPVALKTNQIFPMSQSSTEEERVAGPKSKVDDESKLKPESKHEPKFEPKPEPKPEAKPEIGDIEEATHPALKTEEDKKSTGGKDSKCGLILDISAIVCLFLMSIFFVCGTVFFHPGTFPFYSSSSRPNEPCVLILMGYLFYIAFSCVDVVRRKSKGLLEIVAASNSILSGILRFIASIFLFSSIGIINVWEGFWIFGCIINLCLFTFDLIIFFPKSNYVFVSWYFTLDGVAGKYDVFGRD